MSMCQENLQPQWVLEVSRDADRLVRQAAAQSRRSLSGFVIDAAVTRAGHALDDRHTLADRTHLTLEGEQWNGFVELLERQPQPRPQLQRLLATPSIFIDE